MASWLIFLVFAVSLSLTLGAAAVFAHRLDHIGPRVGFPESLTGLLTALAADSPEISSALVALAQGEKRVSLGVVLGSNVFNLAAMIGVSAILAGAVRIGRQALLAEGAVALLATLIGAGLIAGVLAPLSALFGFAVVLVPYVFLLARGTAHGARVPMLQSTPRLDEPALWRPATLAFLAVALIVVGSIGMVGAAVTLADRWEIPKSLVGVLVLAILTSLPNAFTAIRLGVSHRGTALVSEALNSNTINLLGGVMLPALVLGLGSLSSGAGFELAWLLLMTSAALLLLGPARGIGRLGGGILIALYLVFVVVELARY
jgi:cation:H+ antiporter